MNNTESLESRSNVDSPAAAEQRESEQFRALVLSRDFKAPLLPGDAAKLLELSGNAEASIRELEQAIRNDPLVAARVISLANSAAYARSGTVSSLKQASMRIGADGLRDLLAQAVAESYIFRGQKRKLEQIRRHSVAVAHLARKACHMLDLDPEMAFLCGLFHDVGHPILLQMLASGVLPEIKVCAPKQLIDGLHPLVGERVAKDWGLPYEVGEVARFHHMPQCCAEGRVKELTRVVAGVDRLAYHLHIGEKELNVELEDDPRWEEVGFSLGGVMQLRECALEMSFN